MKAAATMRVAARGATAEMMEIVISKGFSVQNETTKKNKNKKRFTRTNY